MKSKNLLILCALIITELSACSKKNEPFDQTSINTVYWDIPTQASSAKSAEIELKGEVGNNRDIDTLSITVYDLTSSQILKSVNIPKSQLSSETRKDFSSSTIKWYKIAYKPGISFTPGHDIKFVLVARTPFGTAQDLRPFTTSSTTIE